jgi:probable HAF family extracellular repeat protein
MHLAAAALGLLVVTGWRTSAETRVFFMALPENVLPAAVGGNAFVIAGGYYRGGAFFWMPTSGDQPIAGVSAADISRDGKTIVGDALDSRRLKNAAIWTADSPQWRVLGSVKATAAPCDDLLSSALGATSDGSVIVGLAWDTCSYARAFRWQESTGMVDLGSVTGSSTRANAISDDGRVVVGWRDAGGPRQAVKWVDGRQEDVPPLHGLLGEAHAANRDGSIIIGDNCDPAVIITSSPAWMWTRETGVTCYPVQHPNWLPRNIPFRPYMLGMSDDGRVVGGSYSFGLDAESLLWLDGRAYFLKEYLAANGLPNAFDRWINTGFILDVSPDGRTLVGYGAGPTGFTGYIVILPGGAK